MSGMGERFSRKQCLAVIGCVLVGGCLVAQIMTENRNVQRSNQMTGEKYALLSNKLDAVLAASNPGGSGEPGVLEDIQKDLASIENKMPEIMKLSNMDKLAAQLDAMGQHIDSQMATLDKKLPNEAKPSKFLKADALPWQVVSVDNMEGQLYVSVKYQNHVQPLMPGESLAGWKVTAIDEDGSVELSSNGKIVKITTARVRR